MDLHIQFIFKLYLFGMHLTLNMTLEQACQKKLIVSRSESILSVFFKVIKFFQKSFVDTINNSYQSDQFYFKYSACFYLLSFYNDELIQTTLENQINTIRTGKNDELKHYKKLRTWTDRSWSVSWVDQFRFEFSLCQPSDLN